MYCCNKLVKGKVKFDIDWINGKLRLIKDFPESIGKGASFSKEWVSFNAINTAMEKPGHCAKFSLCFTKNSSNNAPMLAAILKAFGCIDDKFNLIKILNFDMELNSEIELYKIG